MVIASIIGLSEAQRLQIKVLGPSPYLLTNSIYIYVCSIHVYASEWCLDLYGTIQYPHHILTCGSPGLKKNDFTPHTCTRGEVISRVVVIVDSKIAIIWRSK